MATPAHCLYCFESLAANLEHRDSLSLSDVQTSYAAYLAQKEPSKPSTPTDKVTDPDAQYPLFVTWDQLQPQSSTPTYHLRGCIGTFAGNEPLSACLAEFALKAALEDDRFHSVTAAELPSLRCAVTLLTNFEDCADMDDWVVGEHGIKIRFRVGGGGGGWYSGTYLPSVAPEQGWDKNDTLYSLMRKAGWYGSRGKWREVAEAAGMQVVRYRGDKEEVDYAEYKEWRGWVSENWKQES